MTEQDEQLQVGGRFALALDDGYRVVFRRADGALPLAIFVIASALVLGITLGTLLRESEASGLAWGLAATVDLTAIYVFHAVRKGLSKGGLVVDGAEKRVFLPQGAELVFERLVAIRLRQAGDRAELVLVHETGEIPFGPRPAAETRTAAEAVARVTELPLEAEGLALA